MDVTFRAGVEGKSGGPDLKNFLGVGVPSVKVNLGTTLLKFSSPSCSRQEILGLEEAFFLLSFTLTFYAIQDRLDHVTPV